MSTLQPSSSSSHVGESTQLVHDTNKNNSMLLAGTTIQSMHDTTKHNSILLVGKPNTNLVETWGRVQYAMTQLQKISLRIVQCHTTTMRPCQRIQLVLSLRPSTSGFRPRGGARDINRTVQFISIVWYSYIHEQANNTRVPDQRGTHVHFVGARADALGCIWLKNDLS